MTVCRIGMVTPRTEIPMCDHLAAGRCGAALGAPVCLLDSTRRPWWPQRGRITVTSLGERLRHRSHTSFDQAVRDAVLEGPGGEAELAVALGDVPESRRVEIAAALGDARGDAGPAALRRILEAPAQRDLTCAALLALAKRCATEATADLASALASRDGVVKDYAMLGLAGAGDDTAWDEAFGRLKQLLRRPGPPATLNLRFLSVQSPVAAAICYLGRHLDGPGGHRTVRLVGELQDRWDYVGSGEKQWLAQVWPECTAGRNASAIPAPDGRRLQQWIRDPLFKPIF